MLSDLVSDYDTWVLLLVGGLWDKSGRQCLLSIIALFYRVTKNLQSENLCPKKCRIYRYTMHKLLPITA